MTGSPVEPTGREAAEFAKHAYKSLPQSFVDEWDGPDDVRPSSANPVPRNTLIIPALRDGVVSVNTDIATIRDRLDEICEDSLEIPLSRIEANPELFTDGHISALFVDVLAALARVEERTTTLEAERDEED